MGASVSVYMCSVCMCVCVCGGGGGGGGGGGSTFQTDQRRRGVGGTAAENDAGYFKSYNSRQRQTKKEKKTAEKVATLTELILEIRVES
jgi:hypothetical protein